MTEKNISPSVPASVGETPCPVYLSPEQLHFAAVLGALLAKQRFVEGARPRPAAPPENRWSPDAPPEKS